MLVILRQVYALRGLAFCVQKAAFWRSFMVKFGAILAVQKFGLASD